MRVALIYDCLYPQTIGGIEHRNAQLAAALSERGHSVTLVGMGEPAGAPAGVAILTLGPRGSDGASRTARHTLRFAGAMGRVPLSRFDVVEAANVPFAHLFPLALRCRVARVPLVVTWHEVWGDQWRRVTGRSWRVFAALEYLAAQFGDRVNAVSGLTAGRLSLLRGGDRVPIVPNGIPCARLAAAAAGAAPGPPLISAGRLLPHKRLDLLIAAVAILVGRRSALPSPLLTVVGDGPDRARLETLASELGVAERVRFTGRVESESAVWGLLGGALAAVTPSAREGFGIFPLEAMAAGLPVVYCSATDSAVGELVRDDVEGVAVAAEPAALANALDALLADPGRLRSLGQAAVRRAHEFDWDAIAVRFERILFAAAGRSGTLPAPAAHD